MRVALVDASTEGKCVLPQVKLAGVSSLNNFQYSDQGVTVWRAFQVGPGKLINQSQIEGTKSSPCCTQACSHFQLLGDNRSCKILIENAIEYKRYSPQHNSS